MVQWYSVAGGLASALHVSFTSIRCRYQFPSNPSMVTSGSSVGQGMMLEKGEVRRAGLGGREPQTGKGGRVAVTWKQLEEGERKGKGGDHQPSERKQQGV